MNDFGETPPELDNNNTLTIGGTFDLITDAVVKNFGTISVGGLLEVESASQLTNSGPLTLLQLAQGGDFKDQSSITNTAGATIEVSGGTLNVLVDIANSGGTIQIDDGATLVLSGSAIGGGTINNYSGALGGTIHVTGASKIDGGATLNKGAVTVDAQLTLDTVTVSGTLITDNFSIELDNTVKLAGGATIQDGPITNNGTLEVAGTATLLDDTLTNTSATGSIIQIDDSQTLILSGTEIIGGTINDFSGELGGTIDVTGSSKIDGGATLNNGAVTVEISQTLTLDDVTMAGTVITDTDATSIVRVDGGQTLTLSAATIKGGTLNIDGTLDSIGISAITNASIHNTGTIEATGGVLTIDPTVAVTLNNSGTIEANGGELDLIHQTV
jgi:hypothetical protein